MLSTSHAPDNASHVAAWHTCAADLTAWTMKRLVNRTDVWGVYGSNTDGSASTWTAPAKDKRGRVLLTLDVLTRHFRALGRRDVIGLHSTSPDNRSKWFALDVDQHGDDPNKAAANERAAMYWYAKLVARGFAPLLTQSNGTGGYHLRGLLAEAVETARVFHLVKSLIADHARHGMRVGPESFPKQREVAPPGQKGEYGNWLRVFGRHHTRDFWSLVWDGNKWLHGHDAIDFILALQPSPASLVPEAPVVVAPPRSVVVRPVPVSGDALASRIAGYMRKLPTGLSVGEHRDDVAFHFAAWMVKDLALPDHVALAWLEEWDRLNAVPKGREALGEILKNAKEYGRNAVGSGLTSGSRSGNASVVRGRRGHWTISVRG